VVGDLETAIDAVEGHGFQHDRRGRRVRVSQTALVLRARWNSLISCKRFDRARQRWVASWTVSFHDRAARLRPGHAFLDSLPWAAPARRSRRRPIQLDDVDLRRCLTEYAFRVEISAATCGLARRRLKACRATG
jgi:hypothetical protein